MKAIFLIVFLNTIVLALTAQVYPAPQGKIHFHSSTPMEDIDAVSSEGKCELNTATRNITAKVEMQSFVFTNPMMQKEFNEKYMESDKFPFAMLDAVIQENIPFKENGFYKVTLKGTFELHGVKQERTITGQLFVNDGQPEKAYAEFEVKLEDHKIKVPSLFVKKIADVVKVDVNFIFNKVAGN